MLFVKRLFVLGLLTSIGVSGSIPAGFSQQVKHPFSVPYIEASDKEIIPASPTANTNYSPLCLPADAAGRGISLSGEAKLYRTDRAHYKLGCGCALVHMEEPVVINTCRAEVHVRKGASIVISANNEVTRVLNLSDHKRDSVILVFENTSISLNPGEEIAVVTGQASDIEKTANEDVIRFRNPRKLSVSSNSNALLFEFSLADALKHCLIFKQLSESPRKEDKLLLGEIVKTAAAIRTMRVAAKYTHGQDAGVVANNGALRALANKRVSAAPRKTAFRAEPAPQAKLD